MSYDDYSGKKAELLRRLGRVEQATVAIEESLGLELLEVRQKLEEHKKSVSQSRFAVVVYGAFSDGKSTLIGALTNSLSIPIDPAPKTDVVAEYPYEDFVLVDLPGLFSEHEEHDQVADDYISRANLVLFVDDPVNPLKTSHHSAVRYLLKDLQKADVTLYVLNKMDEVADIDDDAEFTQQAQVKTIQVHRELEALGIETAAQVPVICVAADPEEQGLAYWLERPEEYRKLSRLPHLERAVTISLASAGDELIEKTAASGVAEAAHVLRDQVQTVADSAERGNALASQQLKELQARLAAFETGAARSHTNIRTEVKALLDDVLVQIDAARDAGSLAAVVRRVIGENGAEFEESLNLIIAKETESLEEERQRLAKRVEASAKFFEEQRDIFIDGLKAIGGLGGKLGKLPPRQIADFILKARDALKIPVKFKPWGALNLGKNAAKFGKGLAALGPFLEGLDSILKVVSERKLQKAKDAAAEAVEDMTAVFRDSLTQEKYVETYFPAVASTKGILREVEKEIATYEKLKLDARKHAQELDLISPVSGGLSH